MVSNWTWASAALTARAGGGRRRGESARARPCRPRRVRAAAARSGRCRGGCRRSSSAMRRNSPGCLSLPRPLASSSRVHLAQQAVGERKALAQPRHAVLEGGDVVGDFHHVVERHAGGFVELEQEQVGERRLRALDLGGEDGLPAHVGVEKQGGSGSRAVMPSSRPQPRTACSSRRWQGPLRSRGGNGGRGSGTKARMVSPAVVVASKWPVGPLIMAIPALVSFNSGAVY